jgi:hypothetical protein
MEGACGIGYAMRHTLVLRSEGHFAEWQKGATMLGIYAALLAAASVGALMYFRERRVVSGVAGGLLVLMAGAAVIVLLSRRAAARARPEVGVVLTDEKPLDLKAGVQLFGTQYTIYTMAPLRPGTGRRVLPEEQVKVERVAKSKGKVRAYNRQLGQGVAPPSPWLLRFTAGPTEEFSHYVLELPPEEIIGRPGPRGHESAPRVQHQEPGRRPAGGAQQAPTPVQRAVEPKREQPLPQPPKAQVSEAKPTPKPAEPPVPPDKPVQASGAPKQLADPIEKACAEYSEALRKAQLEEQKWYDQTAGPRMQYYASAEYQAARAQAATVAATLAASLDNLRAEAARWAQAAQPRVETQTVRRDGGTGVGGVNVSERVVIPTSAYTIRKAQESAAACNACAAQLAALVEQERVAKLNQEKELRSYVEELKRRVFARQVELASRGKHQPAYQYLSKRKAVEDKVASIQTKQGVIAMLEQAGQADKIPGVQAETDKLEAELKALEAEVEQAAEAIRGQSKEAALPGQG